MGGMGTRAAYVCIDSSEHTSHCEHMLLGDWEIVLSTISTRIAVNIPDCGMVHSGPPP